MTSPYNSLALYKLGLLYDNGSGVPQDYAKAVKWYRKAAEQGYAKAQFMIGFMYYEGRGVTQDYVQAHVWYNLAVSRLPPSEARNNVGKVRDLLAKRMTPAQLSEAQKLAREWRPKKTTDVRGEIITRSAPYSSYRAFLSGSSNTTRIKEMLRRFMGHCRVGSSEMQ